MGTPKAPPPQEDHARRKSREVVSRTTTEEGGGDVAAAWLLGGMAGGCGCGRSTTRVARALSPPTAYRTPRGILLRKLRVAEVLRRHSSFNVPKFKAGFFNPRF